MSKKKATITTDMARTGTEAHTKLDSELCSSVSFVDFMLGWDVSLA